MSNQRSKDKVRVTVPMEKDLERAISRVAAIENTNRVEVIKAACRKYAAISKVLSLRTR